MITRCVVAVCAALALAGCAQQEAASPLPTPLEASTPGDAPTTQTPSATPRAARSTSTPTRDPDNPLAPTPEQEREITAVIEQWYSVLDNARTTLDPSAGRALIHPDCKSCARNLAFFDERRKLGERVEGGEVSITKMGEIFVQPGGRDAEVQVTYKVEPMKGVRSDGSIVWDAPAESDWHNYRLRKDDGRNWKISYIEGAPS